MQQYDWSTVATEIVHVYETVTEDPAGAGCDALTGRRCRCRLGKIRLRSAE